MLKTNQVSENITIQSVPQDETPSKDFSLAGHTLIAQQQEDKAIGDFFPTKLLFSRDSDGAEVTKFGCHLCLAIMPTAQGVGIHVGRVHRETSNIPVQVRAIDPIYTLERVVEALKERENKLVSDKQYEKVVKERDYWKREAQIAKRKLEQIRTAIAPKV